MGQTNANKKSYLSAINIDDMEAIVNSSSVKTVHVRNLQVMLSFRQTADENMVIK